ncbi:SRPBCC family protein [Nocardioides sp.]|jgi:hypothetical protein|uniref:SRPBCC family protein n=1 Tax=Nocardioides sp. TaxID=35761 RepID=UPI0031FED225|nr:hypothetical protein [Nocardioides sp.]
MTFEFERTVTTSATSADIWELWSDPGTWVEWDPAVNLVELDGPFVEGQTGTMVLTGPIEVPFTLEVVEDGERFLDQLVMGDLVIRIDHLVKDVGEGSEVTVRTTIEGPGADDIGPIVTQDTPVAMEALVRMAERG